MDKIKLRQEFEKLRNKKSIKYTEMERFAKLVGRTIKKGGTHPNWVNNQFKDLTPVSIPHHGHGSGLNRFTANDILDKLEEDLEKIEELT